MSFELPEWFCRMFSSPRFVPYRNAVDGDDKRAWDLYRWNIEVSEAFYCPLHCLEVSLRNAQHIELSARFGRVDWWVAAPLRKHELAKIAQAERSLRDKGAGLPSADDVIAELSFGFWVSLLSRSYDRYLWVPVLHRAFPHYSGRREGLRDNLQAMVLLRNRVMHHEPIHHRRLEADHVKIYRLLGYLEPAVAVWLRDFDRVPEVLKRRPEGRGR
ncbi:hypothetical protein SAMN05216276_101618 [Streptosporangium subroseum]|uniref:Abi-like protein n=1 Tax=Streptosporangium subroseum TaxID=106412 RepID=A0A239HAC4_9ACTN|nr:hypothetical protein [Streptosporangium subroseum]SNS78085.1 hypothetical protein SAMN05216276_101618 [Streptosporangium subroseum]